MASRRWWVWCLPILTPTLAGCQLSYYLHSAYHQSKLINERVSIERALRSTSLSGDEKRKLKLVQEVKAFAEAELGLKHSRNYTSFVQLEGPYVSYIVQAAFAYELKPYLWKFPFVGRVPYKGFFVRERAQEEARKFNPQEFDTYIRGVSAYSTLGWFQDSVLSSMLRYEDFDLVEMIIHETVHTTLFIKDAADFNERLANFLGQEGMKLFYLKKEGSGSVNLKKAQADARDRALFSAFLTRETNELKKWYEENKTKIGAAAKAERLKRIQQDFAAQVKPKLQTAAYNEFERRPLNNALLLAYQTYEYDMAGFEKLHRHFGGDFKKTLAYLKSLEKDPHPAQTFKEFVSSLSL